LFAKSSSIVQEILSVSVQLDAELSSIIVTIIFITSIFLMWK
jgi:hypothetical protein